MKTHRDIEDLLDQIDAQTADELEGQDLDFKVWDGERFASERTASR